MTAISASLWLSMACNLSTNGSDDVAPPISFSLSLSPLSFSLVIWGLAVPLLPVDSDNSAKLVDVLFLISVAIKYYNKCQFLDTIIWAIVSSCPKSMQFVQFFPHFLFFFLFMVKTRRAKRGRNYPRFLQSFFQFSHRRYCPLVSLFTLSTKSVSNQENKYGCMFTLLPLKGDLHVFLQRAILHLPHPIVVLKLAS